MVATSLLSHRGDGVAILADTTRFVPVGVTRFVQNSTESNAYHTIRAAGVFSGMNCYVKTNTSAASATTVTFRVNTANVTQTFTIGAGATGEFADTTNSDTVAAGDEVSYGVVNADLVGGPTFQYLHCLFAATTATYTPLIGASQVSTSLASTTRYFQLGASISSSSATESFVAATIRAAGTLKHLYVFVTANARTNTSTVQSRKNSANGNQTVSIGAAATGIFEDTTNSDTVAAGDTLNLALVTGTGTETITFTRIGCGFETTTGAQFTVWNAPAGLVITDNAATAFFPVSGGIVQSATEADMRSYLKQATTASNLGVHISANTRTTTTTVTVRKSGADTGITVSIGAGATGTFEDTTNTASYTSSDYISHKLVTGASAENINFRSIAIHLTGPVVATATGATGAGTASNPQAMLAPSSGSGSASGASGGPSSLVQPTGEAASATAAASDPSRSITVNAIAASATGSAADAVVQTAVVAAAIAAAATGVAGDVTAQVASGTGAAGATGAAAGPGGSATVNPTGAAATGTAADAAVLTSIVADAQAASGTGAAGDVTAQVASGTGSAGATGTAAGPGGSAIVNPAAAVSTGSASDADVAVSFPTLVPTLDNSIGAWTDEGGATSDLYQSVDEGIATANDLDWIQGPIAINNNDCALGITDLPADFGSMYSFLFQIRYRQSGRVDDTIGLSVRIMSGATVLAAADAGGTFQVIDAAITSVVFANTAVTSFAYVNTTATKAEWDAAVVVFRQTWAQGGVGADPAVRAEISAVELTGSYFLMSGTTAIAGSASGTGSASAVQAQIATGSGNGSASGAAAGPSSTLTVNPTAAVGTGTANDAAAITAAVASAQAASGTGAASDPQASISTSAGSGSASGASGGPTSAVTVNPSGASSTGTANDATVLVGVTANAQVASATGGASDPHANVTTTAGSGTGTGTASDPTVTAVTAVFAGSLSGTALSAGTVSGKAFDAGSISGTADDAGTITVTVGG